MKESNDDLLDEIHAIRYALHEETKNMTPSERIAYIKAEADEIKKEFGIKAVSIPEPCTQNRKVAL